MYHEEVMHNKCIANHLTFRIMQSSFLTPIPTAGIISQFQEISREKSSGVVTYEGIQGVILGPISLLVYFRVFQVKSVCTQV